MSYTSGFASLKCHLNKKIDSKLNRLYKIRYRYIKKEHLIFIVLTFLKVD